MKIKLTLFAWLVLAFGSASLAQSNDEAVYIGKWSNGRGFELTLTKRTLKLGAASKMLRFVDITKVSDGSTFYLQVFNPGKLNYFSSFAVVTVDWESKPAKMRVVFYRTLRDLFDSENVQCSESFYLEDVESKFNQT